MPKRQTEGSLSPFASRRLFGQEDAARSLGAGEDVTELFRQPQAVAEVEQTPQEVDESAAFAREALARSFR